jgi:hypothetical protein
VDTGRVHEDHLESVSVEDAEDTISRGLGLGRDNGHFPAQDTVQERGLAHIGRTHKGNEAGEKVMVFPP